MSSPSSRFMRRFMDSLGSLPDAHSPPMYLKVQCTVRCTMHAVHSAGTGKGTGALSSGKVQTRVFPGPG